MTPKLELQPDPSRGRWIGSPGVRRRIAELRQLFTSLGFAEEPVRGYLKFTMERDGRTTTLTAGARSRNRYLHPGVSRRVHVGMTVGIARETPIQTRLVIAPARSRLGWLTRWVHRRLESADLGDLDGRYAGFRIWASEPEWARRFLGRREVRDGALQLLTDSARSPDGAVELRHGMSWQPGVGDGSCAFHPARVPSNLSREILEGWLGGLETLTAAAELEPPPSETPPTWLARQVARGNLWLVVLAALLAVPVLILLATAVALGVLVLLSTLLR